MQEIVFVPYRGIYFLYGTVQNGSHGGRYKVFVPYRGIYFLYSCVLDSLQCTFYSFRPLSGNLLSLLYTIDYDQNEEVFVPYRGIYFLYIVRKINPLKRNSVFVPYRGIYFLYQRKATEAAKKSVFVPYRGIYFLYVYVHNLSYEFQLFSSPIGESTFSTFEKIIEEFGEDAFSSPIGESTFSTATNLCKMAMKEVFVPYRGIYFLYPASRTPLFIRVPELFCGAKFKNCFSFSISYACAAFSLILCGAAQNSFYCRENSILPIPISYNFP